MARTMSGSGGFYKYRCKYFYAKSCQNWVYVNGEACITCLAEGCDAAEDDKVRSFSPDVCVPVLRDGSFTYALVSRDGLGLVDGPGEGVLPGAQPRRKLGWM